MAIILPFEHITENDRAAVGGKGYQLARLVQTGLPVPTGFCIKAESLEGLHDPAIRSAIVAAYRDLSGGSVAVRSSAVVEDSAEFSFAGQFQSIVGVSSDADMLAAIEKCFATRDGERVRAYQRQIGAKSIPAMSVIVQRFVKSEIAGVLFTRDPSDESAMVVEAGGGTSVVSGAADPMRVRIDRKSRGVRETTSIGFPIEQLVDLGHRVESLFNTPCDIEWAWDGRQVWILQARPITTADTTERAAVIRQEIEQARKLAAPGGTVWVRQNLADVLPNPTPMTWALMQRMLSGDGGLGRMYRDFGCMPNPALGTIGIYDLIAGRPYLNLSREPRMQYGKLPLGHSFAQLKAEPRAALEARAALLQDEIGIGTALRLPAMLWKLRRMNRRIAEHARTFADRFENDIVPPFVRDCEMETQCDYSALSTPDLFARLERWSERVLGEFARHSLKPAALADRALDDWRRAGGADFAHRFAASFLADRPRDPRTDLAAALRALATGEIDRPEFIATFGHRGLREMELNQPRFCEPNSGPLPAHSAPQPARGGAGSEMRVIGTSQHVERLRRFVALRETAKHHFMLGTFHLRRMLREIDRRFGLQGGVFFLTPEELPRLAASDDLSATIATRRRRWAVLKSLPAPAVLFSDDLEAIGRTLRPVTSVGCIHGVAVSHGVAEGPALVLTEPTTVESDEPYVLVCPSSDPAWTPLLLGASAVVMETGGVLSHGAIVAREFGLPAVGGVPAATSRLRSGERLHVDGGQGTVTVLDNPTQELN